MVVCQLDQSQHASYEDLNKYLLRLRYKQATYYEEYLPRRDKLTNETIPYKNLEQYLSQDFIDKRHLKRWLKENPLEGRAWAINWLKKRKEEKSLIYAPSQVELRSLTAPSIHEYEALGGYALACQEADLKHRYSTLIKPSVELICNEVICDTREQMPLNIGVKMTRAALKVGDYALPQILDRGIYIERKSLNDFIGTLCSGLARFTRELERAHQAGHYIVMLVENDINEVLSFNYLPHIKRHVKAQPSHVFKGLRDLLQLYPLTFQCLFVNGRKEAAAMVKTILELGEQVKKMDLQLIHEKDLL